MNRPTSDAELYMEVLTRAAVDGNDTHLARLNAMELRQVFANRAAWARLMLSLAVRMEAPVVAVKEKN